MRVRVHLSRANRSGGCSKAWTGGGGNNYQPPRGPPPQLAAYFNTPAWIDYLPARVPVFDLISCWASLNSHLCCNLSFFFPSEYASSSCIVKTRVLFVVASGRSTSLCFEWLLFHDIIPHFRQGYLQENGQGWHGSPPSSYSVLSIQCLECTRRGTRPHLRGHHVELIPPGSLYPRNPRTTTRLECCLQQQRPDRRRSHRQAPYQPEGPRGSSGPGHPER